MIRAVDSRGRLSLGLAYANRQVIINNLAGGVLQIVPAEVVPAREAWLYKNPKALAAVLEGMEQAKAGKFVEGPDLEADSSFADTIEE